MWNPPDDYRGTKIRFSDFEKLCTMLGLDTGPHITIWKMAAYTDDVVHRGNAEGKMSELQAYRCIHTVDIADILPLLGMYLAAGGSTEQQLRYAFYMADWEGNDFLTERDFEQAMGTLNLPLTMTCMK